MNTFYAWIGSLDLSGLVDIAIITLLIYTVLVWMKHRKRAAAILTGIVIVAVVYLLARQFNLHLTAAVLQGFFAIIIVVLVVIFQEELRYVFEQIARWSLKRRLPLTGRTEPRRPDGEVGILVRTAGDLARERIGALIVLKGKDTLVRHLEGGENLGGHLSEAVLKSIFDPHSIGHDGAVVIEGGLIDSFGRHLPLSRNLDKLRRGGTRHAAALGLAELCDALCLVVSEERGTISLARHGEIKEVDDPAQLEGALESFYSELHESQQTRPWQGFFKRNSREKFLALGMALALWFVLVHEAEIVYRTFTVPVQLPQLQAELTIVQLEPKEIEVTLSGQRKDFYFFGSGSIRLQLKPWEIRAGTSKLALSTSDFILPDNVALQNIDPREVSVTAVDHSAEKPKAP